MYAWKERLARGAPALAALGVVSIVCTVGTRWIRHDQQSIGIALAVGTVAGGLCRVMEHAGRKALARWITYATVVVAIAVLVAQAVPSYPVTSWRAVVTSWALLCAPLAVSVGAVLAAEQRPLATLAGGAALVTLWGHWYAPAEGALVVLAFLFARDVGALDRGMPLRQTFTLAGVGTLAVITALGLGFDLAMSLGGYPEGEYVLFGVYLDDPATRWPRIAVEGLMLLACLACTRGRSWGVLALLGLAPALCALSYWGLPTRVSGCISTAHPFAEIGLVALAALALAVGPWLVPFARQLRSR